MGATVVTLVVVVVAVAEVAAAANAGGDDDDDDDDACSDRRAAEAYRCAVYKEDAAHPDYYPGCLSRAKNRWGLCYSNRGKPRYDEPPEWRPGTDKHPGDEETWLNHRR